MALQRGQSVDRYSSRITLQRRDQTCSSQSTCICTRVLRERRAASSTLLTCTSGRRSRALTWSARGTIRIQSGLPSYLRNSNRLKRACTNSNRVAAPPWNKSCPSAVAAPSASCSPWKLAPSTRRAIKPARSTTSSFCPPSNPSLGSTAALVPLATCSLTAGPSWGWTAAIF